MVIFEILKLGIFFGLILLLPGIVILQGSRRFRGVSLLAIFSYGFLISVLITSLCGLGGILLGIPRRVFVYAEVLIMIMSVIAGIFLLTGVKSSDWKKWALRLSRKLRPEDYAFFAILIVVFVLTLYRGAFLKFGDVWLHIAYTVKFFRSEVMNPSYPFFRNVPVDINYGYCPLYPIYGLLCELTGRKVLWVWYYLPAFFAPLVLAVNYYFARLLTQSRFVALVSIVFLIYFTGMIGGNFLGFAVSAYPRNIGILIMFPLLWLLTLQTLRVFSRLNVMLCFAGFVALMLIHKLSALHFLIAYIIFALTVVASRAGRPSQWYGRLALLFAYMVVALVLYLLVVPVEPVNNPVHLEFRRAETWQLGETPLFIAAPHIFLFQAGPITAHTPATPLSLFSYLLLPGLFLSPKRNSLGKLFLLASIILLPVTIFNPFVFPIMAKLMTIEGSVRLVQIVPYHLIFPYSLYLIIQNILTDLYQTLRHRENRYYIAGVVSFLTIVFLSIWVGTNNPHKGKFLKSEEDIYNLDPLFQMGMYITENFQVDKERLMADFYSSYVIGGLTNVEVMGIPETMSSPNHPFIRSKNLAIYRFFSPLTAEQRIALLKRWGVTLLLFNPNAVNPVIVTHLEKEFAEHPETYHLLKKFDSVILYRISTPERGT